MLSILPLVLGLQIIASPRLKTRLDNGAVLYARRIEDARELVVGVFASSREAQDQANTWGHRHLLEHLLAKGKDRRLDLGLERKGCFLTAATTRRHMRFMLTGGPQDLPILLSGVKAILQPPTVTTEEIEAECRILDQELALTPEHDFTSRKLWAEAFEPPYSLDPAGDLGAMKSATSSELKRLYEYHFAPRNLVIVVAGEIDPRQATEAVRKLIEPLLPSVSPREPNLQKPIKPRVGCPGGIGLVVPGLTDTRTLARIGTGLVISGRFESSALRYTPTAEEGLVQILEGSNDRLADAVTQSQNLDPASLGFLARARLRAWLGQYERSPASGVLFDGSVLVDRPGASTTSISDAIDQLSDESLAAAIRDWSLAAKELVR